jgi:type I restriction enzyme S subunit
MVPYLRAANVRDGQLDLTDVMSMNFSPSEQQIFPLRPGDVLVTEGSGSLSTVGASAAWSGELLGTVCFQNTLLRMRPKQNALNGRFLQWWARAAFASGLFASVATGANIYHLSAERVRALPLRVPSLDEQRRIADFLDAETARLDRMAALQQAVASKLTEREVALLDWEIDRLADAYGFMPFRRFIQRVEQGTSPQCDNVEAADDEWGVLKVSAVKDGTFQPTENKLLPPDVPPARQYEVKDGDLLVTRANTPVLVGAATVVRQSRRRLLICDKIFRIDVSSDLNKEFLVHVARGTRIRVLCAAASHGTSQSMANLKVDEIKRWPIPAVPLLEQRRLADLIDERRAQVSELRTAIDTQLALLAERRQALITAAVTGQMDVTTARRVTA